MLDSVVTGLAFGAHVGVMCGLKVSLSEALSVLAQMAALLTYCNSLPATSLSGHFKFLAFLHPRGPFCSFS